MISVYYPYDFEAHKNLSHKQFLIQVYYFMDYAVIGTRYNKIQVLPWKWYDSESLNRDGFKVSNPEFACTAL